MLSAFRNKYLLLVALSSVQVEFRVCFRALKCSYCETNSLDINGKGHGLSQKYITRSRPDINEKLFVNRLLHVDRIAFNFCTSIQTVLLV